MAFGYSTGVDKFFQRVYLLHDDAERLLWEIHRIRRDTDSVSSAPP